MKPSAPQEAAGYLPWWLLAVVAAGFCVASVILVGLVALTRTADLPQPTATPQVLTVAAPAGATAASPAPGTPSDSAATQAPPTATAPPPLPSGGPLHIGAYVQVTGTGADGFLNLRSEASLKAPVNYLAIERQVFQVQAGPVQADGFVWWYLVDPSAGTRFGWAVQNYLQLVQGQ